MKILLAAVIIGGFVVACSAESCSAGYKYDSKYKRCWKYFDRSTDFYDANSLCEADGGNLPSIHSISESQYVSMYYTVAKGTWIGLQRSGSSWKWTDGTPYDFKNGWYTGYPSSDSEDKCVFISSKNNVSGSGYLFWRNWDCTGARMRFVCIKKAT